MYVDSLTDRGFLTPTKFGLACGLPLHGCPWYALFSRAYGWCTDSVGPACVLQGTLHARRQAAAVVRGDEHVFKLFNDFAERYR